MFAKVTKEFQGRPDSEPLARTIAEGEIVSGDLAKVAIAQKCAKSCAAPKNTAGDDDAKAGKADKEKAGK
jgi:hypothetical protein